MKPFRMPEIEQTALSDGSKVGELVKGSESHADAEKRDEAGIEQQAEEGLERHRFHHGPLLGPTNGSCYPMQNPLSDFEGIHVILVLLPQRFPSEVGSACEDRDCDLTVATARYRAPHGWYHASYEKAFSLSLVQ
jgi:hypothetical protein